MSLSPSNFSQFGFDSRILERVVRAGYVQPTPIQQQAIPVVMAGDDVLGIAQTGTGKTAAFMLPLLHRLTRAAAGKRRVRVLVVAPTRELAEQTREAGVEFGGAFGIRCLSIYGGVSKRPQDEALRRGVDIVVACPGRLLDHLDEGTIDLSGVEVLVLDEADRMCDMGFMPDVRRILRKLPTQRQTLFFSATMPADIRTLADQILHHPVIVEVGRRAPAATVSHALYPVPEQSKKEFLLAMLAREATGRVLVFTRTKHRARSLAVLLDKRGHRASALQGNMTQGRRQDAIDGFRNGRYDILVATDIAARGLDINEISYVINYDMPDTVEAYTHRIGRTGRAERTGEAFTFTTPADDLLIRGIEKALGARIERRTLPEFNYTAPAPATSPVARRPASAPKAAPKAAPKPAQQPMSDVSFSFGRAAGAASSDRQGRRRRRFLQG